MPRKKTINQVIYTFFFFLLKTRKKWNVKWKSDFKMGPSTDILSKLNLSVTEAKMPSLFDEM